MNKRINKTENKLMIERDICGNIAQRMLEWLYKIWYINNERWTIEFRIWQKNDMETIIRQQVQQLIRTQKIAGFGVIDVYAKDYVWDIT